MNAPFYIRELVFRHIWKELTPEQEVELITWRSMADENEQYFRDETDPEKLRERYARYDAMKEEVFKKIMERYPLPEPVAKRSLRWFLRTHRIAAIVIFSAGVAAFFLFGIDFGGRQAVNPQPVHPSKSVDAKGISGPREPLTQGFRDGYAQARLDRARRIKGVSALTDPFAGPDKQFTLLTPPNARYCLGFPDGTRIWMNKQSSVTYPNLYTGDSVKISVKGEVYVELTQNKSDFMPFRVSVGNTLVTATTGRFNIKASSGDSVITITAIDGDLLIHRADGQAGTDIRLHARGQAVLAGNKMDILHRIDLPKVIAWKTAEFQ